MGNAALLHHYLLTGGGLFALGMIGFLSRRNLILMFLAVEIMLQGVALTLVGWGRYHGNAEGQVFVLFIIAVAAAEAAVALALVLNVFRTGRSLDVALLARLREDTVPPRPTPPGDLEIALESPPWPRLPTAGKRPEIPAELTDYRSQL
ncbi:MAG: hypothetical protein Kow0040_21230 [Thermogutta sp.]